VDVPPVELPPLGEPAALPVLPLEVDPLVLVPELALPPELELLPELVALPGAEDVAPVPAPVLGVVELAEPAEETFVLVEPSKDFV